ncbi:MAG: hypothetical protein FRX49_08633 [Trebouxia sp. A1-2]|nr:MAG: hypothetical protein FRX49_08633 [Trebouxia sp. A1-2]
MYGGGGWRWRSKFIMAYWRPQMYTASQGARKAYLDMMLSLLGSKLPVDLEGLPGAVYTLGQDQCHSGLTSIARQHWICRGHPLQQVIYEQALEVSSLPFHGPLDGLSFGHGLKGLQGQMQDLHFVFERAEERTIANLEMAIEDVPYINILMTLL